MKQIHECKYNYGVMTDVVYRHSSKKFHCRRCEKELDDNQVEDSVLILKRRKK